MVAIDVDGTIVPYSDFHAPPSGAVQLAVRGLVDRGIAPVIATGRSLHSTYQVFDALGLDEGFAVCSNGAVVVDLSDRTPVKVETFDALAPVRFFAEQVPDAILAVEELGEGFRISGENVNFEFDGRVTVVPHNELVKGPVTRLVVRWHNGDREELRALAASMGFPAVDYAIGYTAWLDIMPAGVTKATALADVVHRLGITSEDVLAFGDGHNDMSMLRWSGWGVAMGNAHVDVQQIADEVAPDISEDGLVRVVDRIVGP